MPEFIYLIQEREFIKTKQDNLKIMQSYPTGSIIIIICQVPINCDIKEKNILKIFKDKYISRSDIGKKYFEGDYTEMRDDIFNILSNKIQNV